MGIFVRKGVSMLLIFLSVLYILGCILLGTILNDSEMQGIAIWGIFILVGSIAQYRSEKYDKR